MEKNKLAFSVIIPTYNRPKTLTLSINSVLKQDLKSYEILLLNDCSTDNTEEVIKSFKDKRIKYIKNKINLGFNKNMMNGFKMAKGKYIFLLSDDDFVLKRNALSQIYKEMEQKNAGFGEMRLITFDEDYTNPCYIRRDVIRKTLYYPPDENIFITTMSWHLGFMSGNVFRRSLIKNGDIINNIWYLYFKAILRSVQTLGCLYFGNQFIMARISKDGNIVYMDLKKNKGFYYNILFKIYKQFERSHYRLELIKKWYLDCIVEGLLGTKYYTSNINIILLVRGLVKTKKEYLFRIKFWQNLIVALLIPKAMFGILRFLFIKFNQLKNRKFLDEIKFRKHLYELGINS